MLKVIGKTIELTRGDTARIQVEVKDNMGNPYDLQEGDVLEFTVRVKPQVESEVLIHKIIPPDSRMLVLDSSDTAGLACGEYVYDIQLTLSDGDVNTIIPVSLLMLRDEVTI